MLALVGGFWPNPNSLRTPVSFMSSLRSAKKLDSSGDLPEVMSRPLSLARREAALVFALVLALLSMLVSGSEWRLELLLLALTLVLRLVLGLVLIVVLLVVFAMDLELSGLMLFRVLPPAVLGVARERMLSLPLTSLPSTPLSRLWRMLPFVVPSGDTPTVANDALRGEYTEL